MELEFLALVGLAVFLCPMTQGEACPSSCSCESLGEARGLLVDCSSRRLRAVPALPPDTRILYLHNNNLTSVPVGALDLLPTLERVEMFGNPWHCDCHILYLKLWLQDFSAASLAKIRCASPAALRMKPLGKLTGNELGRCKRLLLPIKCLEFFWRDLVLIAGTIIALILVAWALKLSKKLVCQLNFSQFGRRGRLLRGNFPKNYKVL